MRVRTLAWVTFLGLLRNKILILLLAAFLAVVLLMMAPLEAYRSMAAGNRAQTQGVVLSLVTGILTLISGFGSLLAAWAAADVVSSEMRTGTILAVMARPIPRWQFLLGKYCGVLILMAVYVIFMFGVSNILAAIGGERLVTSPWVLLVYPMVRYAIYAAMAILLVTMLHSVIAFVIVLLVAVAAGIVAPISSAAAFLPDWIHRGLYILLPSVNLLSETNFLAISSARLNQTPWTQHAIALGYGLDYAVICLLLAAWTFRRRSLVRE